MTSWRDEYLGALQERDKREKANSAIYASCQTFAKNMAGVN